MLGVLGNLGEQLVREKQSGHLAPYRDVGRQHHRQVNKKLGETASILITLATCCIDMANPATKISGQFGFSWNANG